MDVTNFVNQFVVGYLAPVLAAWLVLRGVVEVSEGRSPLYSILGAMFLLSIASTQALLQGWNSGTKFATADVLAGLWTYTVPNFFPEFSQSFQSLPGFKARQPDFRLLYRS